MSVQDHMNALIVAITDNKENTINAIRSTADVIQACKNSEANISNMDSWKYVLGVRKNCQKLMDDLLELGGTQKNIFIEMEHIKEHWDGCIIEDEHTYLSRYNKEKKLRERAEKKLKALDEIYGRDVIRKQLIEWSKYHDIKL